MRLENSTRRRHYPHFLSVLGKPANPYILQTREHLSWYRLLNEMQMFMHQHEVNQRAWLEGAAGDQQPVVLGRGCEAA